MAQKINWHSIPIRIDESIGVNSDNPYSSSTQDDRDRVLRDLIRAILLRRAKRIASN